MKYFILLFGILSVILFCCFFPKSEDYVTLAHIITNKTAKKLQVEKGLHLIGTGGRMMDDIKIMYMGFDLFHSIDLKSARELLIFAIKEYLCAINSDEKIRPYLHVYPFTAKNVEIDIWIRNPNGSIVSADNQICLISAIDGILTYYVTGPEEYSRKAIQKETYEEAEQANASNNPGC